MITKEKLVTSQWPILLAKYTQYIYHQWAYVKCRAYRKVAGVKTCQSPMTTASYMGLLFSPVPP